ncbi:MDL2 (YPL270W) [Zygosaccharomyces parabailii]|nr:MDL2 (YPL270W) [Zygosaccharomyces parabailii]CDH11761.1 probable ATP-dependent permease MDL2,mitochondrial [Zygosaccharomyces bailii ISA1307]
MIALVRPAPRLLRPLTRCAVKPLTCLRPLSVPRPQLLSTLPRIGVRWYAQEVPQQVAAKPTKQVLNTYHKKESSYKDAIRLFSLAKRDWRLLCAAIALLTISCGIGMSIPKVIGLVLDVLRTGIEGKDLKDVNMDDLGPIAFGLSIYEFLGAFAGLLLVGTVANFARIVMLRILSERVVARLRSQVMKKTLHQDAEFFDTHKVGDLISRLGSDAYVVSRSMTQKVSDGFKALICGGVGVGMMVSISPELSGILLFFAPPILWSASVFGKRIRDTSKDLQEATGQLTKVSEEQLSGVKTVQSFVAEQRELHRYNSAIRGIFNVGKTAAYTNAEFFTSTTVLGDMSFLVVLLYGSYLVLQGQLTIGDLTAFMLYTEYTGTSVFGLTTFYSEVMQGVGAASRLFDLTDHVPSISPTEGHKFVPGKGEIEFKNVSFSYPTRPENQIFKDINIKVPAGSNVCIVGPSGRGKSTIALLLLRYYNPSNGEILIDGQDISKLNSKSLRRHIGLVQQEPILMSGTIRDNITYGLTRPVSKDEIRSVSKQCFCHNFITKFPNGYDTVIGAQGALLSGGQRQRIAIARALIKKPSILVLDEATSALDVESEGAINYTFGQLMKSKAVTIVSIAHRLSTIRRSENVIVLGKDGSVIETGKFKELFSNTNSELSKLLTEKSSRSDGPETPPPPTPATVHEKTVEQLAEKILERFPEASKLPEATMEEIYKDVKKEGKPVKLAP